MKVFTKTAFAFAAGIVAACAQAGVDPASLPLEKLTADVVVVGSGGTGMAAGPRPAGAAA